MNDGSGVTATDMAFLDEYEIEVGTLYETVVTAQRPALSAGAESYKSEEIASAHPSCADDVLRLVPGMIVVQHGAEGKGHQLFIRGFDAAHGSDVEVLLNGIGLNEPSQVHGNGYLDLYGIIPELITEMKVDKGPFLPWQASFATAGSVRFELGVPAELGSGLVRNHVSHRGHLRAVAVVAPQTANEHTFTGIEAVHDDGFGPDRRARRAALISGYGLQLGANDEIKALVMGQTAQFESPGALKLSDVEAGIMAFHSAYGPAGAGRSDRGLLNISWDHEGETTKTALNAYAMVRRFSLTENYTGWLFYDDVGDRKQQAQSTQTVGVRFQMEQRFMTPLPSTMLAGLGWRLDVVDQVEQQVDAQGKPWQTNRDLALSIQHVHVYAGWRLSPWRWIALLPSIRFDLLYNDVQDKLLGQHGRDHQLAVSPRLALSLPLHNRLTLFGNYGRGFRPPEARAVVAGTQPPEDETLSQYTGGDPKISVCDSAAVGVQWRPLDEVQVKLAGFATWIAREMVFDHVANLNLERNRTRRIGVELSAFSKPTSWTTASAALTWVSARFSASGHPIPGVPTWMASGRIQLGRSRGPRGSVQVIWIGTRHLAHGATVNGYARLDADAGWRFEAFEITALIENLSDQNIMEGAYHYASHFNTVETPSAIPKIHYTAAAPITGRLILTIFL
ncbi:MAG: TonB-dependent receptor [Myxococcota bacterium]|nr:TonB-dependent receptor [Myxococcota bacterium]